MKYYKYFLHEIENKRYLVFHIPKTSAKKYDNKAIQKLIIKLTIYSRKQNMKESIILLWFQNNQPMSIDSDLTSFNKYFANMTEAEVKQLTHKNTLWVETRI